MEKISAVVITYNEEKNIERCINSLLPAVEEIIVVDSFSTDGTEEICSKFEKVHFYQRKFDGFSSQKNWAFGKISFPIVLSLDADEVISEELLKSINSAKKEWTHDGYFCNRLTNYCGKWIRNGGWYPDTKLRLWDIRKGCWDDALIHEKVAMKNDAHIGFLKGDILHYSYNSIAEHVLQTNRFTDLNAQYAFEMKKKSSVMQILLRPLWKFFSDYFVKRGFLDGYYGLVVTMISAFATFLKYVKLRELNKFGKV
jgi:glycosyltransferase involved in cell wall biosynthesis